MDNRQKRDARYREKHRDKRREWAARWREKNREALREAGRRHTRRLKAEVLNRYGTQCPCGFSDPRALQIDHVNDNGAEERKALGGQHVSGKTFYYWLKRQGWPNGYQTLCANCNAIKQAERNGWTDSRL